MVVGTVTILDEWSNDDVQRGLALLAAKSPMVQGLIDSESLGDFVVLRLDVESIEFNVYSDILEGEQPTLIEF